ncbi:hypothetical protein HanIR_Chr04g0154001 [Helianthus annuus]|nr:hypothetical protein HanIR_Chr04g0154001 [Helianthus annuus]
MYGQNGSGSTPCVLNMFKNYIIKVIIQLTNHHFGMYIDHEPASRLCFFIIRIRVRPFRWFVFAALLHLTVPKAKEREIISRVILKPLGFKSPNDIFIHHLHSPPLPIQYRLNRCTLGYPFGPHRDHNINRKLFMGMNLTRNL